MTRDRKPSLWDGAMLAGAAAFLYGLSLVARPLPWLAGGFLVMWLAFTMTKPESSR